MRELELPLHEKRVYSLTAMCTISKTPTLHRAEAFAWSINAVLDVPPLDAVLDVPPLDKADDTNQIQQPYRPARHTKDYLKGLFQRRSPSCTTEPKRRMVSRFLTRTQRALNHLRLVLRVYVKLIEAHGRSTSMPHPR